MIENIISKFSNITQILSSVELNCLKLKDSINSMIEGLFSSIPNLLEQSFKIYSEIFIYLLERVDS